MRLWSRPVDFRKTKFLLAGPDPAMHEGVALMLKGMGFEDIAESPNGSLAWSHLKYRGAHAVVASWDMPEMNGMALLKVVRSDPELANVHIILVADSLTKAQVIEAGEAGVSDIVITPINSPTFVKKIQALLELGRDPQAFEAQRLYAKGLQLMEEKRWEEALESFRRILGIYESAEIYYNMGYISTARGSYEEAIHYFRKATQINNAFAQAHEKMGECYRQLARPKLAQKHFEQAADIYMERRMDSNAEQVLNQVLELNPNTINVYNSLGILYRRQGRYELAIKQYKKALKVNPEAFNIHYNLARIYYETKDYPRALILLEQALKINPEFADAQDMLGTVKLRLGKGKE